MQKKEIKSIKQHCSDTCSKNKNNYCCIVVVLVVVIVQFLLLVILHYMGFIDWFRRHHMPYRNTHRLVYNNCTDVLSYLCIQSKHFLVLPYIHI